MMTTKHKLTLEVTMVVEKKIEYIYHDWNGDVDEADVEHIQSLLSEGYTEGQLVTIDPNDENKHHLGWWKLVTEER